MGIEIKRGAVKMTIEEMIKKYRIVPCTYGPNKGKLAIQRSPRGAEHDVLMAAVPSIKKYFADQQASEDAERARRKANVASIPGLAEIDALRKSVSDWHRNFNRSFDDECRVGAGKYPEGSETELRKKYPQADAYIRVRAQAEKRNCELAAIGEKALRRFEDDPESWESIVAEMKSALTENSRKHMWD